VPRFAVRAPVRGQYRRRERQQALRLEREQRVQAAEAD
jgi:hypothetical protein